MKAPEGNYTIFFKIQALATSVLFLIGCSPKSPFNQSNLVAWCIVPFDPEGRRAGIPEDIAALIDQFSDSEVSVILVNTSPTAARELIIQAGV